jgi:hypothetical protein
MIWRLQYATKGRNSFAKMYALDLSRNGNTVKTKYLSMLLKIQENPKKVDILENIYLVITRFEI